MTLADKLFALANDQSTTEEERRSAAVQYVKQLGPLQFEVVDVKWSVKDGGGRVKLEKVLNDRSNAGWTLYHFTDAPAAWTCVFTRRDPK